MHKKGMLFLFSRKGIPSLVHNSGAGKRKDEALLCLWPASNRLLFYFTIPSEQMSRENTCFFPDVCQLTEYRHRFLQKRADTGVGHTGD